MCPTESEKREIKTFALAFLSKHPLEIKPVSHSSNQYPFVTADRRFEIFKNPHASILTGPIVDPVTKKPVSIERISESILITIGYYQKRLIISYNPSLYPILLENEPLPISINGYDYTWRQAINLLTELHPETIRLISH